MRIYKIPAQILLFLALFSIAISPIPVTAGAEEDLDALQQQINALAAQRQDIQNQLDQNNYTIYGYSAQASKLAGEAQIYQNQIDQLNLEIQKLEVGIAKLEKEISDLQADIIEREAEITGLEKESNKRIKTSYMNFRTYGINFEVGNNIIFNDSINSYFKNSQYKELMQDDTNDMLVHLFNLKVELEAKKEDLASKLLKSQNDKVEVNTKLADVNERKGELDVKLNAYYAEIGLLNNQNSNYQSSINNLSNEEMMLQAQAFLIMQEIMKTTVPTGVYVLAGTVIGVQGCTGYCFGEHLHFSVYMSGVPVDPCSQLEGGVGCGNGGPLKAPLRGNVSFNSGFGMRWGVLHDGIDITAFPLGQSFVYAAHDGYLERGVDCWHHNMGYPTDGCANYARIHNPDTGVTTGYWHLAH